MKGLTAPCPRAAAAGVPNMIMFFGNRQGLADEDAIENCVAGLTASRPAEEHGVTICMELLNSKVDHKDYQCDNTAWAWRSCAVESPRFKLLYDIYHMQIMEGDVIRTIRDNDQWIAHFHTGGVPGRHELDDTQELNWRRCARPSRTRASPATSPTSSCRRAIRSPRCARRSRSATCERLQRAIR